MPRDPSSDSPANVDRSAVPRADAGALRLVLDALPSPVWVKHRDGRFADVNRAYAVAVGRKGSEELVGLTDDDIWPPDMAARAHKAHERVMEHATTLTVEQCARFDDQERWYEVTLRPWFDAAGAVIGTIGLAHDITRRQQNREVMEARWRLVEFASRASLEDLLRATLDEAEHLTRSLIGFYHFVAPDEQSLVLQMWSTRTMRDFCRAEGKGLHYAVDKAGVWVDCIRERRAVIHNDYASLTNKRGLPPGHAPVIRELVIPVFREGRIVALMGVGNRATPYGDDDVEAASQLADLAWDIADRKRSDDALRESEQRYRELFEAESDAILLIDDESGCILEANSAATLLYGYTRDELLALHESDLRVESSQPVGALPARMAHASTVLRSSISFHRTRAGAVFPVDVTGRHFTSRGRSTTIAAIRDVSERQRYEDQLAEQHRRLAEAYASLQAMVVTDALTGLLNRRAYDTRLVEERARATRGKALSLLMIDVDRFKDFNDRFGHAAGDDVLVKVARLLLGATRGTDSVARYGGEEFVVIAPDADVDGATHLAERCRAAVANADWPKRSITVSVGVATWTVGAPPPVIDNLALDADRALYAAKSAGRDCVRHASTTSSEQG